MDTIYLRELAAEGAAIHADPLPEREVCDGLLWALDEIAELRKDADRLQAIRAWTKGQIVICPPGTHGGEPGAWLVTFEDDARWDNYGSLAIEHKAKTLDAAIDAAVDALPAVGAA